MTGSSRISLGCPRRSGTRRRRVATLSALAAACLALSACAAVPTSGPIEEGPIVDAGNTAQFIRVIAAPPSVGASPSEIVRGFLEANASLDSGHAIARRYLTSEAAESWDPGRCHHGVRAVVARAVQVQGQLNHGQDGDQQPARGQWVPQAGRAG